MRMSDLSSVVCSSDLGTPLPSKLKRPEALAYDSESDVFYVAGGWSADLFKVSRSGEILETITVLRDHRLPDGGHAVPKGLALAPSSDGSGTSLWVVDYGDDQVSDGRRSEEHTSELQSLMRISYAVFCLKKKKRKTKHVYKKR